MRDHAEIFQDLADETRLRALHVLHRLGELCVCDLEAGLEITQSRASRHLRQLRQVGLVDDRRDGAWVYYRLADDPPPAAAAALEVLFARLKRDPLAKADVKRTRAERRSPCC